MSKIKLFCFPHLGGSASIYYQWNSHFPANIEICPIELAGRGERIEESFYKDFNDLLSDAAKQVINNKPDIYAFWGHSMGALIAYEVACYIMEHGVTSPIHIFFSGRNTPDLKDDMLSAGIDDGTFIEKLNGIGGIPKAIYDYPELVQLILPVLKADYSVMNTYDFCIHKQKLKSDISIITGDNDETIIYEKLNGWNYLTENKCSFYSMVGGHFYMEDNFEKLVKLISSILSHY